MERVRQTNRVEGFQALQHMQDRMIGLQSVLSQPESKYCLETKVSESYALKIIPKTSADPPNQRSLEVLERGVLF